jgi:vacuolar-type H+-ATPase subunit F/Vma7
MRIVVIGDDRDVRGFALAGVGGRVCRDRRDVERAFAEVPDDTGLILLSASAARLAAASVASAQAKKRPALVVLPKVDDAEGFVAATSIAGGEDGGAAR